jgi:uncharacterized membrane protein
MKLLLAHSQTLNPFDLKAALLAGHAQHPVLVHFPIGLFIASIVFDLVAIWRKQPVFATVAYYNLLGAALTVPLAIATGLGAWQWQLEGTTLKGNLRLHMICALISGLLIILLCCARSRLRAKNTSPGVPYVAVTLFTLMAITLTGHLGGIVSGIEMP